MWNEIFAFDVETGKEEMKIEVFDKDDYGKDDYLGWCTFKLDDIDNNRVKKYLDQGQHDENFDLKPLKGTPSTQWHGKLRLIIQYVYSKVNMITGYIHMFDSQIKMDEQELKEMRMILKHLESPFDFI